MLANTYSVNTLISDPRPFFKKKKISTSFILLPDNVSAARQVIMTRILPAILFEILSKMYLCLYLKPWLINVHGSLWCYLLCCPPLPHEDEVTGQRIQVTRTTLQCFHGGSPCWTGGLSFLMVEEQRQD